jgi:hypothetical protein
MNNQESKKSKYYYKYYWIIIFLVIMGYFIYSISESKKWSKELKPFLSNFLEVLQDGSYKEFYESYVNKSKININETEKQLRYIEEIFGNIVSYEFIQDVKAFNGKILSGFSMIYQLKFDSGKTCQGHFIFEIDENLNRPLMNKIRGLSINCGSDKIDKYYLQINT